MTIAANPEAARRRTNGTLAVRPADTGMGSVLRAGLRGLVYLCLTLTLMPVQAAALGLSLPLRETLPRWYHRRCCQILGFHIERRGQQMDDHPTLYVANCGYKKPPNWALPSWYYPKIV